MVFWLRKKEDKDELNVKKKPKKKPQTKSSSQNIRIIRIWDYYISTDYVCVWTGAIEMEKTESLSSITSFLSLANDSPRNILL